MKFYSEEIDDGMNYKYKVFSIQSNETDIF